MCENLFVLIKINSQSNLLETHTYFQLDKNNPILQKNAIFFQIFSYL